jgi:hypothetical protein
MRSPAAARERLLLGRNPEQHDPRNAGDNLRRESAFFVDNGPAHGYDAVVVTDGARPSAAEGGRLARDPSVRQLQFP